MAEGWIDFGQKVDLTARIREILLNYPEGTSILKEVIQVRPRGWGGCQCNVVVIAPSLRVRVGRLLHWLLLSPRRMRMTQRPAASSSAWTGALILTVGRLGWARGEPLL